MIRATLAISMLALLPACQSQPDVAADLAELKGGRPAIPVAAAPPPEPLAVDWASLGSCRDQLRELLRLAAGDARLDPGALPFGVVTAAPVGHDRHQDKPAVPVAADLPVPVNDAAAQGAPCLLRVGLAQDLEATRRIVGQETVTSEYQTGVRREDNPAYEIAKFKVDRAKRRVGDEQEVWTEVGDPMMDLVGLLVGSIVDGFSAGARESELDEAMLELAKTPRKIDQPVYAIYHFDRVIVDAARRASLPVELVDRRHGTTSRTTIRHTEHRRFHVLQGLSRRDRNYADHEAKSISQRDLTAWLRSPPELPLSGLAAAMLDQASGTDREVHTAGSGFGRPYGSGAGSTASPPWREAQAPAEPQPALLPNEAVGPPDDDADLIRFDDDAERPPLMAEFGRPFRATGRSRLVERAAVPDRAAAVFSELSEDDGWRDPLALSRSRPRDRQTADLSGDARFESVVLIRNGGTLGSGFYIRPHLVVTNYHVVEEASLVDLVSIDGTRAMGVVTATDVGRDLALVHTPDPGPPAPLYDGPELRPGLTVDAIGAPHGYDFTLTRGIVSAVRTRPALLVPSMQQVRYVQTDAAINRGNSGGPLFLGERVIGVNDRVEPEAVSGGLNFAIHVEELKAFLDEEGVQLSDDG